MHHVDTLFVFLQMLLKKKLFVWFPQHLLLRYGNIRQAYHHTEQYTACRRTTECVSAKDVQSRVCELLIQKQLEDFLVAEVALEDH